MAEPGTSQRPLANGSGGGCHPLCQMGSALLFDSRCIDDDVSDDLSASGASTPPTPEGPIGFGCGLDSFDASDASGPGCTADIAQQYGLPHPLLFSCRPPWHGDLSED